MSERKQKKRRRKYQTRRPKFLGRNQEQSARHGAPPNLLRDAERRHRHVADLPPHVARGLAGRRGGRRDAAAATTAATTTAATAAAAAILSLAAGEGRKRRGFWFGSLSLVSVVWGFEVKKNVEKG